MRKGATSLGTCWLRLSVKKILWLYSSFVFWPNWCVRLMLLKYNTIFALEIFSEASWKGKKVLVVESDSTVVVPWVKKIEDCPWNLCYLQLD
ncbi:Uncharacterized protein TCM_032231 [Theobroma cacao]|uniref:Uncharacterized protein n=1 Tax=Theobroma cacao TaxID=3641 RepID=A0A061FA75_THECC|nr:Uncharacterized protein TCM_032231 [Theobroma cacao]